MAIIPFGPTPRGSKRVTLESGYICSLTDEEHNDYGRMIVHAPEYHDAISAGLDCTDPVLRDCQVTAGRYLEAKERLHQFDERWYLEVVLAGRHNRNAGQIVIVPGEPAGPLTRAWRAFWRMMRWPS